MLFTTQKVQQNRKADSTNSNKALFSSISNNIDNVNAELPSSTSVSFDFANIPIHAAPIVLQTKLTINKLGDENEREADAMADKVMRMTGSEIPQTKSSSYNIHRKCASCKKEGEKDKEISVQQMPIQRKCTKCEEEEKVHRKEKGNSTPTISAAVHQTLHSSGQPLDKTTRSFMEDRFGFDFGKVRIHNDSLAHQSAKDIDALAYTYGNNIVFDAGQYQTTTEKGKKLLSHELTHVIQQHKSSYEESLKDDSPHEQEAARNAQLILHTGKVDVAEATGVGIIRNDGDDEIDKALQPLTDADTKDTTRSTGSGDALSPDELIDEHVFGTRVHEEVGDLRIRIAKLEKKLTDNPKDTALKAKIDKMKLQLAVLEGKAPPANMKDVKVPGVGSINTRAAIQIVDADGNTIMVERGSWKPDMHAEEDALAKLRVRLGNAKLPPGTKIIVVGNQVVCQGKCTPALEQFAKDYGAESVDSYIKTRPRLTGTGQASGKTTERTRLQPDVPKPELSPAKRIYTRPSVAGGGTEPDVEPIEPDVKPSTSKIGTAGALKGAGKLPPSAPGEHLEGNPMEGMGGSIVATYVLEIADVIITFYIQQSNEEKVKKAAQEKIEKAIKAYNFDAFIQNNLQEITIAQAEGKDVHLQVIVNTGWNPTKEFGYVLTEAQVGNVQLLIEDGPPPKPYEHKGRGGIAGKALRGIAGTKLDQETFKILLKGTDPIAKHHRQSRKDIDKLRQPKDGKQMEYEELILQSYSGGFPLDDLADYARYKQNEAIRLGDKNNADYWNKMYRLVIGPVEDVIIQAKIKSIPLEKFKGFATKLATEDKTDYWSEIAENIDEPLPDKYLAEKQRYQWTQPASKAELDDQMQKVVVMEKELARLEELLKTLMNTDARTPDELRGHEPPHPPWAKITEVQKKIVRLKENIDIEKRILKDMKKSPPIR